MATQALLPILPFSRPLGRPDPDAEAVRRRAGVEYFELQIKIKKIKDILELSEQSKNAIRSKQQRDLESLIFSELKFKAVSIESRRNNKNRLRSRD